jgi:hypothetical protein
MTKFARRWALAGAGVGLALLTGCGPASNSAAPSAAPASNASSASPTSVAPLTAALPPMPDPDTDSRPDRVKFEDFAAHLERQQSDFATADADFLGGVRSARQSGGDAKLVLAGYRAQIAADIAALPGAPRLSGCFARAAAPNAKAEAAIAAMLSDRRDKADAVAAITDRPLTLPDFGGLATDIATGAGAADAKASLAAARAAVAGCSDATAAPARRQGASKSAQAPSASSSTPPTPTTGAPPAQVAPTTAPPTKKPSLFQRLFGGGS